MAEKKKTPSMADKNRPKPHWKPKQHVAKITKQVVKSMGGPRKLKKKKDDK